MSDAARASAALYKAQILAHSKQPRNEGPLPEANREATKVNPFCGDRVTVRLKLAGEHIEAAAFEARGCAIAKASASILTGMVGGGAVEVARARAARLLELVRDGAEPGPEDGELALLAGVHSFRSRRRCATLAWEALETALQAPEEQ